MKTSEKLLRKLKTQFPKECSHMTKLCRFIGVSFCWSSYESGSDLVFSYDTMIKCLKNEIKIEPVILFNGKHGGYIVKVVDYV